MPLSKTEENRIVLWVLAALAHSVLMAGFVWLTSAAAGKALPVSAAVVVWCEFLTVNMSLYILMARSHRAWKAKQASSRGIWVIGSILGGGNLALAFHMLAAGGALPTHIETLLLTSTLIIPVAACCAGIFLFARISDYR